MNGPRPYLSPYLAGIGIGLALLAAFLLVGRGLGATGAYSTVLASAVQGVAPEHARATLPYAAFLGDGSVSPLRDWLVIEIAGVLLGGWLSALWSGRFRFGVERGPRSSVGGRLGLALTGGLLMGVGAMLARGCTSGQGLTGGALFSVGAWVFIACAFLMAYLVAPGVKRQWT